MLMVEMKFLLNINKDIFILYNVYFCQIEYEVSWTLPQIIFHFISILKDPIQLCWSWSDFLTYNFGEKVEPLSEFKKKNWGLATDVILLDIKEVNIFLELILKYIIFCKTDF